MRLILGAAGVLAALTVFTISGTAFAQQPGGELSAQDRTWMAQNAQTNMAEIVSGQLAAEKGTSDIIRSTGQHLMMDHQQVLNQLQTLAQSKNMALPSSPNQNQQQEAQQLRSSSGAAFDAIYVQREIQGHQLSISQTQQELRSGSDPQVKQLATAYLPKADDHLRRLRDAQQQLGGRVPNGVNAGSGGQAAAPTGPSALTAALAGGGAVLALAGVGLLLANRRGGTQGVTRRQV